MASGVLSVIMTLTALGTVSGFAAENKNASGLDLSASGGDEVAYITPGSADKISIIGTAPGVTTRRGKKCWYLNDVNRMYLDIDDGFAYMVDDGSTFDFEFEYSSENNAFFEWRYDAWQDTSYFGKVIEVGKENIWKTEKITVSNARFCNELKMISDLWQADQKGDFWLSTKSATPWFTSELDAKAQAGVYISSIKITKHKARNPVTNFTEFDNAGNVFEWYKDDKVAHNELTNTTDERVTFNMTCTGEDQFGNLDLNDTQTVTLEPKETKVVDTKIDTQRCGIFKYNVHLESDDGKINSDFGPWQFTIVKTDPNGIKDEHSYIHAGYGVSSDEVALDMAAQLASFSNAEGVRVDMPSDYFRAGDASTNGFKGNWGYESYLDSLKKYGVKVMAILAVWDPDTPTIRNNDETFSTRVHDKAAASVYIRNYLTYLKDRFGDIISYYEFWNEPKTARYPDNQNFSIYAVEPELFADAYMDIATLTAEICRELNPDIKLVSGDLGQPTMNEDYRMYEQLFKDGILDVFDAITIHSYAQNGFYEDSLLSGGNKDFYDQMQKLSKLYPGKNELKIFQTESGATRRKAEISTPFNQGNMDIRGYMISRKIYEVWTVFSLVTSSENPETFESGFGLVGPLQRRNVSLDGDVLKPYDAYVQEVAKNYFMAQTEYKDLKITEDERYIAEFDSKKFGGEAACLWKKKGTDRLTLDLGVNELTYSDGYGNEDKVYSDNGVFSFEISERPVYIHGKFKDIKIIDNNDFNIEHKANRMAKNDTLSFDIKYSGDTTGMTLEGDENSVIKISDKTDFKDGKATISYNTSNAPEGVNYLKIKVMKDGKIRNLAEMSINVNKKVNCSMNVSPMAENYYKWKLNFNIENTSQTHALRGKIHIKSPEIFSVMEDVDIGVIPIGKNATITANSPNIYNKKIYMLHYDIITDTGETFSFVENLDFTLAPKRKGEITIDAKLGENEWDPATKMSCNSLDETVWLPKWYGPKDKSGDMMLQWDEDNLYMMSIVTDDIYRNVNKDSLLWNGDSVQVGIKYPVEKFTTVIGDSVKRFNELTFAMNPDGKPQAWKFSDQYENFDAVGEFECELAVRRDETEKKTYFEAKIPWTNIMGIDKVDIYPGLKLGFSIVYNEDDGEGRQGWMEYASGIAADKDSSLFTYLTLVD